MRVVRTTQAILLHSSSRSTGTQSKSPRASEVAFLLAGVKGARAYQPPKEPGARDPSIHPLPVAEAFKGERAWGLRGWEP